MPNVGSIMVARSIIDGTDDSTSMETDAESGILSVDVTRRTKKNQDLSSRNNGIICREER